jgi:DNA-binding NarL/FixJ family response regulator
VTRSIPGRLDATALEALYGTPGRQPTPDRDTARVAAHELASRGLLPADIAAALRISEATVRELLGASPNYHRNTKGIPT